MRQVEDDLEAMSGGAQRDPRRLREVLIESMNEQKNILKGEAKIISERPSALPDFMMDEIHNSLDDPAPKGYEDLLEAYYKRLSSAR